MIRRSFAAVAAFLALSLPGGDLLAEEYDWDNPGRTEIQLLLAVMRNGNTEIMEECLAGGLEVDSLIPIKRDRVPLLSLAVSTGQAGLAEFLLARGADVDQMSTATVTRVETALKTLTQRRT